MYVKQTKWYEKQQKKKSFKVKIGIFVLLSSLFACCGVLHVVAMEASPEAEGGAIRLTVQEKLIDKSINPDTWKDVTIKQNETEKEKVIFTEKGGSTEKDGSEETDALEEYEGDLMPDMALTKTEEGKEDSIDQKNQEIPEKKMYLTFDDGPNTETTNQILDILKERNIKATFFLVGENVERNPETTRRIAEEGHTIGIHCYRHDYNEIYSGVDAYVQDFEKARQVVLDITGVDAKIFRFPGGSINGYNKKVYKELIATMTEKGYVYFDWNASLEDAVKNPSCEKLVKNAKESTLNRKKVIMLAHDTVDETAECLEEVLEQFPEYEMRPLDDTVSPIQFK